MEENEEYPFARKRWSEPNRLVWALFTIIGMMVIGWGGFVFFTARTAELQNVNQEVRLNAIERVVPRLEDKLDKILTEVRKR